MRKKDGGCNEPWIRICRRTKKNKNKKFFDPLVNRLRDSQQKNKVGPVCFEMKGNEMKQNITITTSTINKDCIYRK